MESFFLATFEELKFGKAKVEKQRSFASANNFAHCFFYDCWIGIMDRKKERMVPKRSYVLGLKNQPVSVFKHFEKN